MILFQLKCVSDHRFDVWFRDGAAYEAQVAEGSIACPTCGDTDVTITLGEDDVLALERKAFMRLLRTPATLARAEHMLETGKPLRN